MRDRRTRALGLALGLIAAACAEPSGVLEDYSAPAASTDNATADAPTGSDPDADGSILVEEPCVGEFDDRCGSILVEQAMHDDTPSRIAVHFRIAHEDEPGRPVLLLAAPFPELTIDDLELPGRPLIELTSRGMVPSRPGLTCPELSWLPPEPVDADWARVIEACATRLTAAGVHLSAYDATHRGRDIATAVDLLGYEELDVIAPGRAALDLGSLADEGAPWVHRVMQVQPSAGLSTSPAADDLAAMQRVLDAVWAQCSDTPTCTTSGPVEDFLDVITTFEHDPIVLPPRAEDRTGTERVLDDVDWLDHVMGDAGMQSSALFLPELHRALRDRDLEQLTRYIDGSSGSADADGLTSYCEGWTGLDTEPLPAEPLAARWVADTRNFIDAFCGSWLPSHTPVGLRRRWPGAASVVAAAGFGALPEELAAEGEVVVTPTLAAPPAGCVSTVATAWFDLGEIVTDASCTQRPTITRRDTPFDLVDGYYEYQLDGRRIVARTVVPETWTDYGYGGWGRDADPLDQTSLDVYVLPDLDPRAAQDWFVDGWELENPAYAERDVGGRTWHLVTAADPWSGGDQHYRAGFATEGDIGLGFILRSSGGELDALTEAVLVPALDAARLTG